MRRKLRNFFKGGDKAPSSPTAVAEQSQRPSAQSVDTLIRRDDTNIIVPQTGRNVSNSLTNDEAAQPLRPPPEDGNKSHVWDQAYDHLVKEDPELIAAYEKTLEKLHAAQMGAEANAGDDATTSAATHDSGPVGRREKMSKYIETGLQRTEAVAKGKHKISQVLSFVKFVRDAVGPVVQTYPPAALPWTSVCFAVEVRFTSLAQIFFFLERAHMLCLQILMNPVSESAAQRTGIQHIVERTQWYQSLTDVLFTASRENTKTNRGLAQNLETKIVQLYAMFLAYAMKSVRVYHQSTVLTTLRDFVKYDDWETQLKEIKQAEEDVEKDIDRFLSIRSAPGSSSIDNEVISRAIVDMVSAFQDRRKTEEDDECKKLISGIVSSATKDRILDKKGKLFQSCCDWFFESQNFQNWRDDPTQKVLLVSGDPGKGKTMLLCSLVDWFEEYRGLAYFFCLDEDPTMNNQKAVFRSLIREITRKIPGLFKHVQANKEKLQLEGTNGEIALYGTLKAILEDELMTDGIILIDALDECKECNFGRQGLAGPDRILQLIAETSSTGVKWILSSRNYLTLAIRKKIGAPTSVFHVDLDHILPEKAVQQFVRLKLDHFRNPWNNEPELDPASRQDIEAMIVSKAEGTYLYVSLVLDDIKRELENEDPIYSTAEFIRQRVESKPKTLVSMYEAMMDQLRRDRNSEDHQEIIRLVLLAERPLHLRELQYLARNRTLRQIDDIEQLKRRLRQGSSLLSIEKHTVSFIHQSARDFVYDRGWKEGNKLLACPDLHQGHWDMFTASIEVLSSVLRRDIYNLGHPGRSVAEMESPDPNPLVACSYAAVYFAHHLMASTCKEHQSNASSTLLEFFSNHLLHWFEALSLIGEFRSSVATIQTVLKWNATQEQLQMSTVSLHAYNLLSEIFHEEAKPNLILTVLLR